MRHIERNEPLFVQNINLKHAFAIRKMYLLCI